MNLLLILPGFIVAFASILLYELDRRKLCKELSLYKKLSSLYRKLSSSSKNNVHFYVTCELNHRDEIIYTLWIGEPYYTEDKGFVSDAWSSILAVNESFVSYNLNYSDFKDMKIGEIKEVFINLND